MKRLLSTIISIVMILSLVPSAFASYSDVNSADEYNLSALRLQDLGIITGYDDGTFRPNNTITRAEFTKIIVCMMDKEKDAKASSSASGFFDVSIGAWYTPYINFAVSKDILSGYADGSFAPDNTINLAEAVTILLRTLGYSEENVGYFWPDNYLNVASSLGITAGITQNPFDAISRATAAILVDRSLFSKPQGIPTTSDTYLETVGYAVLEDALVLETDAKSDNATILSGNMKINNASTYIEQTQLPLSSGDIYNYAVIDRNGYLKTVREYQNNSNLASVTGAVNKLTENTIEYTTTDGLKASYRADDNFMVYYDGAKLNFATAKSKITSGIDISFYGNTYGMWNIAVIGADNNIEPVLAGKNYSSDDLYLGTQPINHNGLTVYRNGEASSLSNIKAGDVVYYNTKTNTMEVYTKKVTGTYYSAYPSKAYVQSVTVAGKSYEIGYSAATSKLDASVGAFEIGDKITLMLGKNDKVVYVSDTTSAFDYSAYGVILDSETRIATEGINEGSSEYVTTLFMADGEAHKIVTDKLYKDYYDKNGNLIKITGKFVRITYNKGVANLSVQYQTDKNDFAGEINLAKRTINGKYFQKDAAIIQLTSSENSPVASCELINFDTLTQTSLYESQIINGVTANGFGDIAILFVKDFENTADFGVITGISRETSEYTIFSNGNKIRYILGNISSISTAIGAGVQFRASGNILTSLLPLHKMNTVGTLTAVDNNRIKLGNTIYNLADNVQVFDVTSQSSIKQISIDDLTEKNISYVSLYSDKKQSQGATVKVITVTTK